MTEKLLENHKIDVKVKLALLWASLMFLYIYADYFELMTPGKLEEMMQLKTPMGPTSPDLLIIFALLLIVPALMIVFSIFLTPQLCKWTNLAIGLVYTVISILIIITSIDSEWHRFYVLFNFIELFVLMAILRQAWQWPKKTETIN
ncbi:MAG: DUF6326 family protein [Cyclobacteriaceae bacterium]|nr:hypothetical protein [Cyclobacteriaceae bacterium]MCB9237434.1 hypothetical protein [Flammeovirgaceae bacterium]MCB0500611.1 hypothetical protein [Cyclobacteriaceae bacterium]MCO5273103.1 DUF6326 family protein [Cyclobacteriaceae bacterium]MCW5903739.1 hypothetical protein [Cyclobacteriaceae bacterium]